MLRAAVAILLLLLPASALAIPHDTTAPPPGLAVRDGAGSRGDAGDHGSLRRRFPFARRAEPHGDGFLRVPMRTRTVNGTGDPQGRPSRGRGGRAEDTGSLGRREGRSYMRDYKGLVYLIDLRIGSPAQIVTVIVDTGSYELWVSPNCTRAVDVQLCRRTGAYQPKWSSTADYLGGRRHLVYGTGEALGTYWLDSIDTGAVKVPMVQFMVAEDSDYAFAGVLGMGYTYPWTTPYPYTLLQMMWAYGFIKAPIFSLALGGIGNGGSEIIFGGVNLFKYRGRFEPVRVWPPIEDQDPTWLHYSVNVTYFGITQPGTTQSDPLARRDSAPTTMLIDSGSTLSYGPLGLVRAVASRFNSTFVDGAGNYWVDCAHRDQRGTVDFGFNHGNLTISVPYRDFIWMQYEGGCLLGIQPADEGSTDYVLGDTFLRAAYLVFDQEADTVWMSNYRDCGDGVVAVGDDYADTISKVGRC